MFQPAARSLDQPAIEDRLEVGGCQWSGAAMAPPSTPITSAIWRSSTVVRVLDRSDEVLLGNRLTTHDDSRATKNAYTIG
jgi:hypothetical protein